MPTLPVVRYVLEVIEVHYTPTLQVVRCVIEVIKVHYAFANIRSSKIRY